MVEPIAARLKEFLMKELGFNKKTNVEVTYERDPVMPHYPRVKIKIEGVRREI